MTRTYDQDVSAQLRLAKEEAEHHLAVYACICYDAGAFQKLGDIDRQRIAQLVKELKKCKRQYLHYLGIKTEAE
jgi:hypothetical protein